MQLKIIKLILIIFIMIVGVEYSHAQTLPRKPNHSKTVKASNKTSKLKRSNPTGIVNGHEAVDLGLSVRWASCNVGASSPYETGKYFPFGDPSGTKFIKFDTSNIEHYYPSGNIINTEMDIALHHMGKPWRMPTSDECKELVNKCKKEFTIINGIKGWKITGPNGNSIFFPTTSNMFVDPNDGTVKLSQYDKDNAIYWSGEANELYGSGLQISGQSYFTWAYAASYKNNGNCVRAVTN